MPYKETKDRKAYIKAYNKAHRDRINARSVAYNKTHRKEIRAAGLKRKFDLTYTAFKAMLQSQGGKCASCSTTEWGHDGPCVDHDHVTGSVRGLLCHACNASEGLLKTPARAQALVNYMKKNKGEKYAKKTTITIVEDNRKEENHRRSRTCGSAAS